MARFFASLLLASAIGISLAACDGADESYAGGGSGGTSCARYTTCGTCTPVSGCGWCFNASGGACATDPDSCTGASEFTWTWDPSGCPAVDAAVVPLDAGVPPAEAGPQPEAGPAEAGHDAAWVPEGGPRDGAHD